MKADLKGYTAIVGGCTRGIGRAIADKFAENEANLVLLSRDERKLEGVAADLMSRYGVRADIVVADFDVPGELDGRVGSFLDAYDGSIDILVNNVRGPLPQKVEGISPSQMQEVLQRHTICSHTLVTHVLPGMKKKEYGRIINIVDTIYHTPYSGLGLSAIRASEASWAKALSFQVARYGITVNNILPGPTETDGLKEIMNILADEKGQSYEEFRQSVIEDVPVGRLADPSEIAHAALFLASQEAGFVTGTNLTIDGGFTPSI